MKILRYLLILTFLLPALVLPAILHSVNNTSVNNTSVNNTADWNFIVYLVSNNDLERFAEQNINEMIQVGSNANVNILIQVDTHAKNESCRYLIRKDEPVLTEVQTNNFQSISGTSANLFGCARWAIKNFPAKHQALILWDHGSGIEDPCIFGKLMVSYPHDIFTFDKKSGLVGINKKLLEKKGIGFNEVFQTYLTNQDISNTLKRISRELLNNKKIDILGMDACFMAMTEIGSQVKDYVNYLVASQEVEPGSGWKYNKVLEVFETKSVTPEQFAKRIVTSYRQAYQNTYTDYTLSCIDLKYHYKLEGNIDNICKLILNMMKGNPNQSDKDILLKTVNRIRNSGNLTTAFTNSSYIDLHHFYQSLLDSSVIIEDSVHNKQSIKLLQNLLLEGLQLIEHHVIKNVVCNKYSKAKGISIYFPTNKIHSSYFKTEFAKNNSWKEFLESYLTL